MSAAIAGMTSTAPSPSMIDQPMNSVATFGLSAVVSDPIAYTIDPITKARRRPQTSPSFAPSSISAAIVSV